MGPGTFGGAKTASKDVTPALTVSTRTRCGFKGQMSRNTGSPCLDKPVSRRGTHHGTHVADITQPSAFMTTKGCPIRQHTPQNTRAHGSPATPTLCHPYRPLLQPAQGYAPQSLLDSNRKNDESEKRPKSAETRGRPELHTPTRGQGGRTTGVPGHTTGTRGTYCITGAPTRPTGGPPPSGPHRCPARSAPHTSSGPGSARAPGSTRCSPRTGSGWRT